MSQAGAQGIEAPEALAALFDDKDLLGVLAALDQEGEETRIVGGALRNALLGLPAREIDLATTLCPRRSWRGRMPRACAPFRPASVWSKREQRGDSQRRRAS